VCESRLTSGIGGELQSLGATLIDGGEHVAPEKWLITYDCDDAIDGQSRRHCPGDGGWGLRPEPYRRKYSGNDESLYHR
jgi:hypothetical protein